MKVLVKDVGKPIRSMFIPNELGVMQQLVDGYIESVKLTDKSVMICNEEGKFNDMKRNFYMKDIKDTIFGPALFVGVKGDEFCDLSDTEAERIRKIFEEV